MTLPPNGGVKESSSRKRKADVLGRVADQSTTTAGRGAVSGWTACPLCGRHSKKKYALGRGIAAHLHAVHTPWKPGKIEMKKRRRLMEREKAERRKNRECLGGALAGDGGDNELPASWEPTKAEQEAWEKKVVEISAALERNTGSSKVEHIKAGLDRTGRETKSYRESLPSFVQAAADGNLEDLRKRVQNAKLNNSLASLLATRDRNGSTAEHWCAGEGHLDCLMFLFNQQKEIALSEEKLHPEDGSQKKMRRRDGKTCLHYAARNGRLDCIQFLIDEGAAVDVTSGDGTTPLHLACYGGHLDAVRLLVKHGADIHAQNEWGCGAAHWVGMAKCELTKNVEELANFVRAEGVSFSETQKQGHSALHKAAQRQNRHIIEWMLRPKEGGGGELSVEERKLASLPDQGNHKPSELWTGAGGDKGFAQIIKDKFENL